MQIAIKNLEQMPTFPIKVCPLNFVLAVTLIFSGSKIERFKGARIRKRALNHEVKIAKRSLSASSS